MGENSGEMGAPEDLSSDSEGEGGETKKLSVNKESAVESEKALSAVYSNMAACYLKQSKYARAIEVADKSLKCDSRNVKAKYRKAQAMRLGGDLYKAREYLEGVLASGTVKAKVEREGFEELLKAVEKSIDAKEAMSRNKWKGFLGKHKDVLAADMVSTAEKVDVKGKGKAKEQEDEP